MAGRLLIRADADERIGIGHVMRCLALAQVWRANGGEAYFLKRPGPDALDRRLRSEGAGVLTMTAEPGSDADARETTGAARMLGARWVAADGYGFDDAYQETLSEAGLLLMVADDHGHAQRYPAHVVLNPNIDASADRYGERGEGDRLLLGPNYVLLREGFAGRRNELRGHPEVARRFLVTMGGADPAGMTDRVLDALAVSEIAGAEVVCLVGPANRCAGELERRAAKSGGAVRIVRDAPDPSSWMAWADLAVSAAGGTCYELACLGVPALVVAVASNQVGIAAGLDRVGTVENLGSVADANEGRIAKRLSALAGDVRRRAAMSERGRALVDGRGAERVAEVLLSIGEG